MSRPNVLIYSGPGVSPLSLRNTTQTLSALLSSTHSVQPLTPSQLLTSPWEPTCALLVLPGGRDLPYVSALSPRGTRRIRAYVELGGKYLALCAGAYFSAKEVEFAVGQEGMEVRGARDLGFWPGIARGPAFPGFVYESEAGARVVRLALEGELAGSAEPQLEVYFNGGCEFVPPASPSSQVFILARYAETSAIAAVRCSIGRGTAVLCGAHPEYALTQEPARGLFAGREGEVEDTERRRVALMRSLLGVLGLLPSMSTPDPAATPTLLPQFLCAHPSRPTLIHALVSRLSAALAPDSFEIYHRPLTSPHGNDTITFFPPSSLHPALSRARSRKWTGDEDLHAEVKEIVVLEPGQVPGRAETPKFDVGAFWEELGRARERVGLRIGAREGQGPGLGELLIYGEAVTSTQTLLDNNPHLLPHLPSLLLSLASHQLSGRGRGSNVWVSPAGCLQFSFLARLPASQAARVVLVQYLVGLAVCEAIEEGYGAGVGVRLKWPNDLYAEVVGEERKKELRKLGGILVNSQFANGEFTLTIGCGLNVLNSRPTTCLADLVARADPTAPAPTLERTLALVCARFERMWGVFERQGFAPFEDKYYERWLHSDQEVTLVDTTPPQRVRIAGITPEHGLLRTYPVDPPSSLGYWGGGAWKAPEPIDLQPDGNSFDMMTGLVRSKK